MNTIKNFEIIEIYNIRTKMFNNLIKAYIYKRKHYNSIIQSANYKRIHMEWLITKTNEFKSIQEPRKLACYCGVAPFSHSSGTSVNRKPRVSHLADKELKKMLHLGAMSAIRLDNDLREYYLRKTLEGKNKMSTLNAVRNKIIHRAFAVIKNKKPYENRLLLS